MQYFFIVVAPVFFSASIYAILSVLIRAVDASERGLGENEKSSYAPFLSPRLILWIFITCDVIATGVQIAGAALIGSAESNRRDPTTPNNILLGGLAFQVFSFFVFCVLLAAFLLRARRTDFLSARKGFVVTLVAATLLVYLRTCFRLAETAQGLYSYLSVHEVFFGCLEFAPVVIAVFLFNGWHPGRCVPKASRMR